jgi:hypothetical protein
MGSHTMRRQRHRHECPGGLTRSERRTLVHRQDRTLGDRTPAAAPAASGGKGRASEHWGSSWAGEVDSPRFKSEVSDTASR